MILLITILVNLNHDALIDSLTRELEREMHVSTIIALNRAYIQTEEYNRANTLLETYDNRVAWNEQALLHTLVGDNLFFAGSLLGAREKYLTVVSRYTKSPAANDALERLYLLETARIDTSALKGLSYCLSRMYCEQWQRAEDSLKQLLTTPLRQQVYYHLALLYRKKGDIPHALSILDEVEQEFPAHSLLVIPILRAEIYLLLQKNEDARKVLEDLIVKHPQTIYAVKARRLLKTTQQ
jgi:tetratricopeptide (TPR) repeat protein